MNSNAKKAIVLFAGLIVYGMLSTVFGPMIPKIMNEFNIDFTIAGIMISAWSIGAISSFYTGKLADKKGAYFITKISLIAMGISSILMYLSSNIIELCILSFLSGTASGLFESSFNQVGLELYPNSKGTITTIMQAFYGVGATIGPAFTVLIIVSSNNWRNAPFLYGIIAVILGISQIAIKISEKRHIIIQKQQRNFDNLFILLSACVFLDYLIGTALTVWLPTFLVETNKVNYIESGIVLSCVWGFITIGRFAVGKIADNIGFKKTLLIFSLLGAFSGFAAIFANGFFSNAIVWGIVGLALSPTYPLIVALTYNKYSDSAGLQLGRIYAIGSFSSFIIPPLFGTVSNFAGFYVATLIIPISSLILFILVLRIK